jgi:hypothetical protein
MSKNILNFNISNLLGFKNNNENNSNITVNNSIKIAKSSLLTNNLDDNSNAAIYLKDQYSTGEGEFYPLTVSSNGTGVAELFYSGNVIITGFNLLYEFEQISAVYPIEFSNIVVNGGYINFTNGSIPNSNVGSNGVGIRYSTNNTVQFKNEDTDWIDLSDITRHDEFQDLVDVDVYTNPLQNNQYVTYNATRQLFVNSNLDIYNDKSPVLGGNLDAGTNSITFTGLVSDIFDNNQIDLLQLKSNTTFAGAGNYIQITNSDLGLNPEINVDGINTDIGININTKGNGDINLNSISGDINLNAPLSNVYVNSDNINIYGYMVNSIFKSSSNIGYIPDTTWYIPITSDTILFNFTNDNIEGTYYANVYPGVEGQKLNIIYNNPTSNTIALLVDFGTNGILTGTGFNTGLQFNTNGQSTSLIYLESDINSWQVLNTGSSIF